MKNNPYRNLSTVLKNGKEARTFLRLPNAQVIVIVESPRKQQAYLVRPAVGGRDARCVLVDSCKWGKKYRSDYLHNWMRSVARQFPEGALVS